MLKKIRLSKDQRISKTLNSSANNIFSSEEFKALVKYERTRSDRNGSVFSIAVFACGEKTRKNREELILKISQFTRSIDCVGFNDDGNIAVLLPDTLKQGAATFGKKVAAELEKTEGNNLLFDIYSYPEHWLANSGIHEATQENQSKEFASIKNTVEVLFVKETPKWKRILDFCGAAFLLIITAPFFLFLTLYIKIVSPGPVFFKQTRIGYKGIPFTFWKFRTMRYDNNQSFHGKHAQSFIKDGDVPMQKLDDKDPRIIFGGKAIRKSCLDELPQLWNILKGDMSLVGPRPCIPYEAKEYLRWHTHRFDTMPGLSGLWQVSGKNKLTFKQMIRLDITYSNNITFFGDLAIIFKTPLVILNMVFEAFINKIFPNIDETLTIPMTNMPERKVQ